MRRQDREITDLNRMEEIFKRSGVCRIAFNDGDYPYIVPLSLGLVRKNDAFSLYFHCANEGKKLDLLQQSNRVGFEVDAGYEIVLERYTAHYESIIGRGTLSIVTGDEAILGLSAILRQSGEQGEVTLDENALKRVTVLRLDVLEMSGKANPNG